MKFYKKNSVKNNIFKAWALGITLFYILGPAHVPLRNILHSISHNLSAPSYVIQHDKKSTINYHAHLSFENESGSVTLDHQHEFIDFIDVIFNAASNEGDNHQGESSVFEIKINEHIGSGKYTFLLKNPEYKVSHDFWEVFQYSHGGFLEQLFKPPKV